MAALTEERAVATPANVFGRGIGDRQARHIAMVRILDCGQDSHKNYLFLWYGGDQRE